MSSDVTCAACSEENKLGAARCARCGVALARTEDTAVDAELADFNVAQAEMAEKNQREYRAWMLKDVGIVATTEGLIDTP